MALQQGSIIWVVVSDHAGRNPKCRPAVVVTPTNEIVEGETFVVVAATSTISKPLPDNHIDLPWKADRHPVTGLFKRCVAVCDWLAEISHSDVEAVGGIVPPTVLNQILSQIPASDS